jgi:hypothetical protein
MTFVGRSHASGACEKTEANETREQNTCSRYLARKPNRRHGKTFQEMRTALMRAMKRAADQDW